MALAIRTKYLEIQGIAKCQYFKIPVRGTQIPKFIITLNFGAAPSKGISLGIAT